MNEQFWLERWERQEIGFHQSDINEDLRTWWSTVEPETGEPVFVPLCGKSSDMLWLTHHGHPVVGVELSRLAVSSFFAENGIDAEWSRHGSFEVAEGAGIRINCGNVFDLTARDLSDVRVVYDRAALIALPHEMREAYVRHLSQILQPGTRILLVTLELSGAERDSPPFSVPEAEVNRLYSDYANVRFLSRRNILPDNPQFAERGVKSLLSCTFLLTLRPEPGE